MRPLAAATAVSRLGPAGTPRARSAMRTTRRALTPRVGAPGVGVRPGPGLTRRIEGERVRRLRRQVLGDLDDGR
jgi:hypothetical protein